MKLRALGIASGFALASASAQAFFFFFIPTGAIVNSVYGSHCVPASAKVGDKLNAGGKFWVVKEINGASSRCAQFPNLPFIAKVEPYLSPEEMKAEVQVCLPAGASAGSTMPVVGMGDVYVRSVSNSGTDCTDQRTPVSARVVRAQYANQPPNGRESQPPVRADNGLQDWTKANNVTNPVDAYRSPYGLPTSSPTTTLPPGTSSPEPTADPAAAETPKVVPVAATQQPLKESKTVAERLRELKQLRDENLITESVYEAKQRDILSAQ